MGPDSGSMVGVGRVERGTHAAVVGLALGWLIYTRFYFTLHPAHLTFDPSLFMYLTGKPDPACGLTRTFAWMWRGDLGRAVAVYPLGPFAFVGVVAVVAYSGWAFVSARRIRVWIAPSTRRLIIGVALAAVLANWIAKLVWLGM